MMETLSSQTDTAALKAKIYSETAFPLGVFFGGPLAAVYMYIENKKAMGQAINPTKAWAIGAGLLVLLLGIAFLIPEGAGIGIAVGSVIAVRSFIRYDQAPAIDDYVRNGGHTYSLWRAVGIGLLGMTVTLVLAVAVSFFFV